jgi:excisionase family DNA binding protein
MLRNEDETSKILTPEDLQDIEAEIAALRAEIQQMSKTPSSPLLTREEAAEYLRVSVRTLDAAATEDEIRPIRVRGRVLYHREALDAFIRSRVEGEGRHHG